MVLIPMRKKIGKVIKEAIKQSFIDYILFSLKCTGFLFLFLFLTENIYSSQAISPLYSRITSITNNKLAYVDFLKQIKLLPEYDKYLSMAKNIYGNSVEGDIFSDLKKRQDEIFRLEETLKRNLQSRDILYSLSKLYGAQGDKEKENLYLEKAKEIDPAVEK